MSFDWKSYLQLSEGLIKCQATGLEEACFRSAISRSYYAIFGIASNYLKSNGVIIPPVDTHKSLRNEFKNSHDHTKKKIGQNLDRLWKDRKEADYNDAVSININKAQISHQMALRILHDLKNIGAL